MPLTNGTRLGQFEIIAPLGAGGMGEVYRAHDGKLGRDVAVKILPEIFLGDPERVGRFQREAQLLAALNHPHIAGIFGLEQSGDTRFLAMELVDGESLAERLRAGAMPLGEALAIARQIGEALQAAHEKGIIHRDLKPANVMLTADGQVKVLDFGLAKMIEKETTTSSMTMSPTLTMQATYAGVILGTAAYMSPEQARGRPADKRSDIWAFGAVLHEMLSGARAFQGEDATDTLAAVVRGEPDWSALPSDIPADIRTIIQGCLAKDRRQRFADISIPLFLMSESRETPVIVAQPAVERSPLWKRTLPIAATALIAAAITGGAMWSLRPTPATPIVTRFPLALGEGQQFTNAGRHLVAISPDGTRIVYVANTRLYLRPISESEARPIPGTDVWTGGVIEPVFSPDGQSVAFYASGAIRRIAVSGGATLTICPLERPPFGMSWHEDEILFGDGFQGIMRVSANGGTPETIVAVKTGEVAHGPHLLPGGRAVLFTLASGAGASSELWDRAQVVVQLLESGERKTVVRGGSDARLLPTGHLVYGFGGVVFAIRFDPKRLVVVGGAVPTIQGVRRAGGWSTGAVQFSSSINGTLVYVPGPVTTSGAEEDLAFSDLQGVVQPLKLPRGAYTSPRVSPDGKSLAVGTDDGKEAIIWIYELSGGSARRRLTIGGRNRTPVWTADGQRIAFQSDREGDAAIFWQRADGSGTAERLTKPDKDTAHVPQSWAPDGKRFLFSVTKGTNSSLWTFSLDDKQATPFGGVESSGGQASAAFSPDGLWVAYGKFPDGIFVQPFPPTGATYQITAGLHPFWSPDGKGLFYVPRGRLEMVNVTTKPSFAFTKPVNVSRGGLIERGPTFERNIDILPDGKRLVGVVSADLPELGAASGPRLEVVENWFEELNRRAPPK